MLSSAVFYQKKTRINENEKEKLKKKLWKSPAKKIRFGMIFQIWACNSILYLHFKNPPSENLVKSRVQFSGRISTAATPKKITFFCKFWRLKRVL